MYNFLTAYTGELAGLFTSLCWSFTSIFFTLSGRIVGSPVVNRTRLILALVMVAGVHWVTQGQVFPVDAEIERWGWFALSGVVGFALGDASLFQAFVMIGPRLAMLMLSLHPVIGTILAWVLLGERLSAAELLGIALAVSGVAWVVTDRQNTNRETGDSLANTDRRYYVIGILFGLGGALGQAVGFIASKQGLEGDFPTLSGNIIRLLIATVTIWTFSALNGSAMKGIQTLREKPQAIKFILAGSVAGPFIGVWASLVAVDRAPVGIASTLTSLAPIILIPLGRLFFKERITPRAIVGTALALAGIVILFLDQEIIEFAERFV
jgi:drug/metabolite transporter (DMT)-like permease